MEFHRRDANHLLVKESWKNSFIGSNIAGLMAHLLQVILTWCNSFFRLSQPSHHPLHDALTAFMQIPHDGGAAKL